jgi:hypothetical protein
MLPAAAILRLRFPGCMCSIGYIAGLPVCRSAGLPVCRSAGLPVCRSAGLPVCRSAGISQGIRNRISHTNLHLTRMNVWRRRMSDSSLSDVNDSGALPSIRLQTNTLTSRGVLFPTICKYTVYNDASQALHRVRVVFFPHFRDVHHGAGSAKGVTEGVATARKSQVSGASPPWRIFDLQPW